LSDSQEEGVWPPPPDLEEPAAPPKPPRVTDQAIGRVSLGLSGLGSLGALACVLFSSGIDPNGRWPSLYDALFIGSGGGFFLGFLVGIVGWHSWEGKAGLGLAVIGPPFWLAVGFFVAVAYSP